MPYVFAWQTQLVGLCVKSARRFNGENFEPTMHSEFAIYLHLVDSMLNSCQCFSSF